PTTARKLALTKLPLLIKIGKITFGVTIAAISSLSLSDSRRRRALPQLSPPPPPPAMLLLQEHVLLLSLRPRATSALLSFRHRCLFSNTRFAAAAAVAASASPAPFAVADYLVASCHLTPAQAVKASKVLSHLKSPSKPEAVLAFLSDLGLSDADVAAVVVYDPLLLCSEVDKTLAPRLAELRDLGLSPSQIARLVLVDPARFRRPTIISKSCSTTSPSSAPSRTSSRRSSTTPTSSAPTWRTLSSPTSRSSGSAG
uniref:Uncharacterized protein n=1 Tax=Aegilops tauschii subsp. strangulata TaxID=200361 RepID=A0A453R5G3_AEGTS